MTKFKLILLLLLSTTVALAEQITDPRKISHYLNVEAESNQISFSNQQTDSTNQMQITIAGPKGYRTVEILSSLPWFDYSLPGDAPDGLYRYEVIYTTSNTEDLSLESTHSSGYPEQQVRVNGLFRVQDQQIINHPEHRASITLSQSPAAPDQINPVLHAAVVLLEWISSDANAVTLVADGPNPELYFDDTDDEDCSPAYDWKISTEGGDSDSSTDNFFQIAAALDTGCVPDPNTTTFTNIVNIFTDGAVAPTNNSLTIHDNGDLDFANTTFYMDKTKRRLGIGTTTPTETLELQDGTPRILFDDSGAMAADFSLGEFDDHFSLEINSNSLGGPVGEMLTLDAHTGYFGLYHFLPEAPLTVRSPDNASAKVLVENVNANPAPRTLFELRNQGNTKFSINNTTAGVEWSFANSGTDFRISRQGSGVVEFDLNNNGDLTIAGLLTESSDRNLKTNLTAIDQQAILEKVKHLPIQQWQYKDAPGENHLGPMAQDFHAAFGLGGTDKGIATLDSSGVALAAIQALAAQNQQLQQENTALKQVQNQLKLAYHQQQEQIMTLLASQRNLLKQQTEMVNRMHQMEALTPRLVRHK